MFEDVDNFGDGVERRLIAIINNSPKYAFNTKRFDPISISNSSDIGLQGGVIR